MRGDKELRSIFWFKSDTW